MPTILLLILAGFCHLWGGDQPAPTTPPPPAQTRPAAPRTIDMLRAFCQHAKLAWNVEGTGAFRIVWAGNAKAPAPNMAETGVKALALLEQWTGKTAAFVPEPLTEDRVCWMVVFPDRGVVNALVDGLRMKDADLIKKIGSFSMPGRVGITNLEGLRKEVALHRSAYYAAVLAIDGWYAGNPEQADKPLKPCTLLREGIAAEVQRATCSDIRVTTVSYEIGDQRSEGTWAKRIKLLLAGKVPSYRAVPVRDAIDCSLDAMPISTYQEIWSVFCYLRDITPRAKKGEDNKLMKLFRATARESSASNAVHQVYGSGEPKLTQAWAAWAQQQAD